MNCLIRTTWMRTRLEGIFHRLLTLTVSVSHRSSLAGSLRTSCNLNRLEFWQPVEGGRDHSLEIWLQATTSCCQGHDCVPLLKLQDCYLAPLKTDVQPQQLEASSSIILQ